MKDEDKVKLIGIFLKHIPPMIDSIDSQGNTVMHIAAKASRTTAVMEFLFKNYRAQSKEMINKANIQGQTPLFYGAIGIYENHDAKSFVDFLMEYGAKLEALDKEGTTILAHCVAYNKATCVEVLLEKGANPNVLHQGKKLIDLAREHIEKDDGKNAHRILDLLTKKTNAATKIQKVVRGYSARKKSSEMDAASTQMPK